MKRASYCATGKRWRFSQAPAQKADNTALSARHRATASGKRSPFNYSSLRKEGFFWTIAKYKYLSERWIPACGACKFIFSCAGEDRRNVTRRSLFGFSAPAFHTTGHQIPLGSHQNHRNGVGMWALSSLMGSNKTHSRCAERS